MSIVIDAIDLVLKNKRLPKEAFFVDTNVVLDFVDPFGKSLGLASFAQRNARVTEVAQKLKSDGVRVHSTIGVALEYYKHIQVGFYQAHTGSKLDSEDFKRLKKTDATFANSWQLQIKVFKKTFRKTFPLYELPTPVAGLLNSFDCMKSDFGDHVLYVSVKTMVDRFWCIFSNDSDFYSFEDSLFLLTTNSNIIRQATADGKLFQV